MAGLPPDPFSAPIPPMEPVAAPAVPAAGQWAFQLKWDGVRMIAFCRNGRVRLQNRRLRDRTAAYPELAEALAEAVRGDAILDGEVVVLAADRPSFPRVMEREGAGGAAAAALARSLPATFVAFDLLYAGGSSLTDRPFWARQELLARQVRPGRRVLVAANHADGAALFQAAAERGWEGVVAKAPASPYLPGQRSRYWLKVKVRRRADCVVGGYTVAGNRLGALLVGLYAGWGQERGLIYVGRVGSGLTEALRRRLMEALPELAAAQPPFRNPPRHRGWDCRWVEPLLTVTVAFAEWTEDLKLRAPSLVGWSRVPPEECRL